MTGQEERDVLFARLFGLTSVIQSGLLLRESTLPSSSTTASSPDDYSELLTQLLALGEEGSMTGQEERDVLFARLFGLTSVIQSGLLLRESTLPSSSTTASSPDDYSELLTQLLALGEKAP